MKIAIDRPKHATRTSWLSETPQQALSGFAPLRGNLGELSIVYLPDTPTPDEDQSRVEFDPSAAFLLNRGTGPETLFVFGGKARDAEDASEIEPHRFGPAIQHDEADFIDRLNELPADLRNLGKTLLAKARQLSPGDYFQRTTAGRYVNRPDNFWTVKIQPRDESFRITVRGRPERFEGIRGPVIKADQNGYSAFKLSTASELDAALVVLKRAKER